MNWNARRAFCLLGAIALGIMFSTPGWAATLFQDQMINAGAWGINSSSLENKVTFNYDYSADGIPEAPNSQGADEANRSVKLESNLVLPTAAEYFTIYPLGENFTGNYQLRFDAWMNYDAEGGEGTTEFLGGGIGYDNVTADIASGAQTMATGDGGSSNDWRAFKSPPQFFIDDADMAAGTHQGSDPYYADFLTAVAPPAAQGQGAVTSRAGSPGFQWITWELNVVGNQVSVNIEKPNGDRLLIVKYDKTDTSDGSAGVETDGNISLFYADFFSSVSPTPARQFGLIDNVVVSEIPEPATLMLLGLGALSLVLLRRERK